jgi:NAD(P)-dependent dehydrogenase (short-subunit alcohol dehydrogenase family)
VAALDAVFGGVEDADWDLWHQVLEVNFFGAMYLVQTMLPKLAPEGASVVFVGSQTMYMPPAQVPQAGYAASKAAVIGAMRHMAIELGRRRIRVNNVAPGWMWGPAVESYVSMTAQATGDSEDSVRAGITANRGITNKGCVQRKIGTLGEFAMCVKANSPARKKDDAQAEDLYDVVLFLLVNKIKQVGRRGH